jgi:hypothetical protein
MILAACTPSSDNPLAELLSPENLDNAEVNGVTMTPASDGSSIVLRFPSSETPGTVVIPVPEAARDWSHAGTFIFESTSSSTIFYSLTLRNAEGETFRYRVHPFADVPVKVAIPGRFLTTEYMNNRQFKGYWLSNWSNHINLTHVESLEIQMAPNSQVTLQLSNFTLTNDELDDEILADGPMVDEFGQWIAIDWPGKIGSLEELREAWSREDEALEESYDFGFSRYGGWKDRKEKATGFFHTAEIDGRWWLVDPDGYLFYSVGNDCVRYRSSTQVAGREKLFAKLPPGSGDRTDFYKANATLRYGEENFVTNWKAKQSQRLKSWGFNTVANWSDPATWENPSVPFVVNLNIARSGKSWHRFPDVYSEEFLDSIEAEAAAQCTKFRDEPFLLGYFTGNEERWPHRHFIDLILKDPEPTATQQFIRDFFENNGDTPVSREKLTETLSRKYFQSVVDAIRKADPNHLILGIRWAGGRAPDAVMKANDVFDVFSLNFYRFQPSSEQIQHLHKLTGRPVMIGEFHFGAVDRGYAPALVMVKNQRERGVAYQFYVERAAVMPEMVGAHYFQFVEQPVTGRFDGENYNFGFVNQLDIPYPEMLRFAREAHSRIYQIHSGDLEPTETRAVVR